MSPKFYIELDLPSKVRTASGDLLARDDFYSLLWTWLSPFKLEGIHEGTVLSEQAAEQGYGTTPWIIDGGLAPESRDWIGDQSKLNSVLYFEGVKNATDALEFLQNNVEVLKFRGPLELEEVDWNAQWKSQFQGIQVKPFWEIVPPWKESVPQPPFTRPLIINPGAGFGTGTHETTQLVLEVIGNLEMSRPGGFQKLKALDFGSGSGILSLGLASLGADVVGIEIDELANENARENSKLNHLENRVAFMKALPQERGCYDLIVANILKPILLEFRVPLLERAAPKATVILSGLIESDVHEVQSQYEKDLGRKLTQTYRNGEWAALIWQQ